MRAYIITKQNELVGKWILRSSKKVFIFDGCEYNINPKRVYRRRIFIKKIFFSIYVQDNPDPVLFESGQMIQASQDIPINELAYFVHLLRKGNLQLLAEIMSIVAGIGVCIAVYYSYKNFEISQNTMNYLYYLKNYIDMNLVNNTVSVIP